MEPKVTVEELEALGRTLASRPNGSDDEGGMIELAGRLLRVRTRDGDEQPLLANAAQRSFETARKPHNIVLKARQMGMTTWIAARFFLKTITTRGTLTVQVAQTREAAEGIFRMAHRFWQGLPESYREGALKRSRSNVRQMIFPALDSEFRVLSAADGNAGRGLTIQNLHCSEVSRWPGNPRETLAGLRAALSPSGELVLESTPNGAYGCFYDEWQRAEENDVGRHFFPWWMEPAYVSAPVTDFTDEELELVQRYNLSPAQIGYRRSLEHSYHALREQEFAEDPERCFRTSGDCCFDLGAIERRMEELAEPATKRDRNTTWIFLAPQPNRRYLVAVDPAGGGSAGDFSVAQVIDLATGIQCAELRRRLKPVDLSRAIAELAREYNHALLVIERNNHGHSVLAMLALVQRYEPIYRGADGLEGWLTSVASRPRALARLGALLVQEPRLFSSRRLLQECRTFITLANGANGAAPGTHDDTVMAMAIAHEARAELLERPVQYAVR